MRTTALLTSDIIAAGALTAATLSLLVSIKGYFVAKKSLQISEMDHQDKNREIIGYLIRNFTWTDNTETFATFAVSYTNNSSTPNSFKDITLEIEYHDSSKTINRVKTPPITRALPENLRDTYEELKTPINLSPKETKSGWMTFQIPKLGELKPHIEAYRIIATSTAEKTTILESYIMTMVSNNDD